MKGSRYWAPIIFLALACAVATNAQNTNPTTPLIAPPNLVLLVRQEFQQGKATVRQKPAIARAQAATRFEVPYSWIDLESISGAKEVLLFNPFDSFDQLEQSIGGWDKIYAAHPDLARLQEQIDSLLVREQSIIAVRRDDLGYLVNHIDLASAHFICVIELHLSPGHEDDFAEGAKILADAYEKIGLDTPWVIYQVKEGAQSSDFIVFMPMTDLKQNDDLLMSEEELRTAAGEENARRFQQIAREAYVTSTSNLYAVSTAMSHLAADSTSTDSGSRATEPPPASDSGKNAEMPAPGVVEDGNPPASAKKATKSQYKK
jgi:hypothetical protein